MSQASEAVDRKLAQYPTDDVIPAEQAEEESAAIAKVVCKYWGCDAVPILQRAAELAAEREGVEL